MTFTDSLRQLFAPTPTPPEAQARARQPAANAADVELVFLVDEPGIAQPQQLLAAIDMLSLFAPAGERLPLTVVHRKAADADGLEMFDRVPRLACHHVGSEEVLGAHVQETQFGRHWRDAVALALARFVQSRFYLVMDCTSICIRPFSPGALLDDGRAIAQWEPADMHPPATAGALALVGASRMRSPMIGTFPFVLSQELGETALTAVARAGRKLAMTCLAEATERQHAWSANAIYSAAAGDALEDFHRPAYVHEVMKALHGDAHVWNDHDDVSRWNPAEWRRQATHGHFLVVQGQDPARIRRLLSRCYALAPI
jgi:hypothetical protein